jgi:hypothetical protein
MQGKVGADFADIVPVISSFTEYDKDGHTLTEITYMSSGIVEQKWEYKYNNKGLLIEEILINDEGMVDEKKAYEYNNKDQRVKEFLIYQDESFDTTEYIYDSEGNLLGKTTVDSDAALESKKEMKYENNKIICEISYDADGKILNEVNYKYDEKGNEIEISRFNAEENKTIRTEFVFNEVGKIVETLTYNSNEELIARSEHEEDSKGQLIKSIEEDRFNYSVTTIAYDEKGNITEQVETNKAGELNSRMCRQFDENNNLIEVAVTIDRHGKALNQNYVIQYLYEYFE